MNKFPLIAGMLLASAPFLAADDVALMTVRIGKQKERQRVAFELYAADAPMHVDNFKKLARDKFYNGLTFHRAFPHLLVQTGDPLSRKKDRGRVGTTGPGYTVAPEIRRRHSKGAVAAARLPDKINPSRMSNGSQFYICLAPMPNLDGQYTVFGNVIYGLDVLDTISTQPVDSNDYPVDPMRIERLQIMPRENLPPPPQPAKPSGPGQSKRWWQIFG